MKGLCKTLAAAIAAAILAGCLPAFAVPRYWEADVARPAAWQTAAYRGETVALTARLVEDGRPFAVPEGATARMLVSTNDFRGGCWEWPAAVSTGGVVRATWTPDMDPGAGAVRIFLAVSESGTNINYGANCTMRLLGSPGAVPNALPLPAATIDFTAVRALNAPWVEEESDPVWKREKSGYATSADLAAIEASASLVGLLLQGSNVVAEVTNYNSRVHAPELRLLQLNESNEYFQVWSESNGLTRTLDAAKAHSDTNTWDLADYVDETFAPRAWSRTTSGLGADAPDGYTWMSTPYTVIAGGLEYEKHVTSGGAIWILKANGMAADFHAQTNNTAYLDLSSADGTPVFRIEKSDSYLVGVDVASLSVDGSTLICGVNAIAPSHPYARVRPSLSTGDWIKEEDYAESGGVTTIPGIATIEWSGSSGAYVCEITSLTGGNSFFACMEYLQEGGAKIVNAAAMDVSAGILCTDGIHKVRPVWNNGSVTWEAVQ